MIKLSESIIKFINQRMPDNGLSSELNMHIQSEITKLTKKINPIPQESENKKIVLHNIKEIVQKNKNSRNHKDIIHEDHQTDTDKYNLTNLNKSSSNKTPSNKETLSKPENETSTTINNYKQPIINKQIHDMKLYF